MPLLSLSTSVHNPNGRRCAFPTRCSLIPADGCFEVSESFRLLPLELLLTGTANLLGNQHLANAAAVPDRGLSLNLFSSIDSDSSQLRMKLEAVLDHVAVPFAPGTFLYTGGRNVMCLLETLNQLLECHILNFDGRPPELEPVHV
jgi:hypothetical protein